MRLFHFARHVPLCQRGERPGPKGRERCRRRSDFQSVDTECVAVDADDLLSFAHFALVPAPAFA